MSEQKRFTIFCNQINKNMPDPTNPKEYYQSYLKRKDAKVLKRSKTITQQPKTLEIPNIVDIKSVLIEHPKTGNVENVPLESGAGKNSDSPLYSETKKSENY